MFKSTGRASVKPGGMTLFRQQLKDGADFRRAPSVFENVLDKSSEESSSEEDTKEEEAEKEKEEAEKKKEEEEALHAKVQAEHMNEIEKKKESEQNYASSLPKC